MAFRVRAKVEGLESVLGALQGLKRNVRNRIIRPAVAVGARMMAKAAKKNVRSMTKRRTGQLAKSIGSVVRTGRKAGNVYAVIGPRKGFKVMHPEFGPVDPTHYAHLVELGTAAHTIPVRDKAGVIRLVQHPGARPRPFMRQTLTETTGPVKSAMARKIREGIEKLARQNLKRGRNVAAASLALLATTVRE